jgi:MFS family permease
MIFRLHGSWAFASVGTWAFSIVLALYAYREGGAGAVGVAALVRMLPSAVAASYTALLVDRHPRRTVLAGSALGRAALLIAAGLAGGLGAPLYAVLAIAAACTAVGTASRPAQAALLAQLVRSPDALARANVVWTTIDNFGFLLGSALAGALAALVGLSLAFGLIAVAFVVSAAVLRTVPADVRPAALPAAPGGELLAGLRAFAGQRDLRTLIAVYAALMLVMAMLDVLLVVVALEDLAMGASGAGWLSSAWAIGSIGGGGVAMRMRRRGGRAIVLGCVLAGLPLVTIGSGPDSAVSLAFLALAGVGFGLIETAHMTLTQRLAADDVLGRVYGIQETAFVVATALGSLVAAALAATLGSSGALIVTGAILPLVAVPVHARLTGSTAPAPAHAFTLLRTLPMFAPLPIAALETLALHARASDFAAGATILIEGETGSDFYVIETGTAEVTTDGATLAIRPAGDFFGEIALARDRPRIATVRATTTLRALVIGRDAFLAAIAATPRSAHELERVMAERAAGPC